MNTSIHPPIGLLCRRGPASRPGFRFPVILAAICMMLGAASSLRAAVLLNFDDASQLNALSPASDSYPALAWGEAAGVGGGGGVSTAAGSTYGAYLYSSGHFDATATGKAFSLSYYFLTPSALTTSNGTPVASVGILKDARTSVTSSPPADFINVRLIKYTTGGGFAFAVNNATSSSGVFGDFSIDPNTWYKMEGLFTQGENGNWTIEMNLWSYGGTGDGVPVLVTTASKAPGVYTAYTGVGESTGAVLMIGALGASRQAAFDLVESNVALVPEPKTALLMGLGLSVGAMMMRGLRK